MMRSETEDLWDGLRTARRAHQISTVWKIMCWLCSFVLVYGYLAANETPQPDPACGEAVPPSFGVRVTRAGAAVGDQIHAARDAHVDPAEVKDRIGKTAAMIGRWVAITVGKAR